MPATARSTRRSKRSWRARAADRPRAGILGGASSWRGYPSRDDRRHRPARPALEPWAPDPRPARPRSRRRARGVRRPRRRGRRIHFLDWGGAGATGGARASLLLPGLLQPAWTWAPVARRLAARVRTRGRGPARPRAVGRADRTATTWTRSRPTRWPWRRARACSGGGRGRAGRPRVRGDRRRVAAARLGGRCGAWSSWTAAGSGSSVTGLDVDEFLRGLDEPPEVLRSMDAYLADRRGVRSGDLGRGPGAGGAGRGGRDGGGHVVRPCGRTWWRRWCGRCSRRTRRRCSPASRRP